MRALSFIFICSFLTACAGPSIRQSSELPTGKRELLFPFGTYQHQVHVKLHQKPEKGPDTFDFTGIFVFKKEHLTMMALTPFGTTLFKVEENLVTHEIKMDIYVEGMKKHEEKIKPFYIATRDVLTSSLKDEKLPEHFVVKAEGQELKVSVSNYDKLNIPLKLIVTAKDFDLHVKVESYEF